ncbi:hypothetical protein [Natrialba swarupiae]|uniref:Uncharacterized protein n=1 Tax=Natrialba swarupiae TaxID=2448032 RepID=A0A5D5AMF9_9EURY|nr:hypothetical protein [Natrialba swarupiae]TYT62203.1 hypothetical protein FYC77_09620 [Natrialba swarupiae]
MSESSATEDRDEFGDLLEEATERLGALEDRLGDTDALEDLEDDTLESTLDDLETLGTVATEAVELIDAVDVGDLPEAVDGDDLLEAIEMGEIPAVLADDDAGVDELVEVDELFRAIDLLSAWNASDLGSLVEEGRELEGAVDDLADDGDDAGVVEQAASEVTDESGLGGDGDLIDDVDPSDALGDIDVMEDPEAYQFAIQQGAMEGIDAFREALLETHATFERLYEFNREKMRRRDTSANSRNPTAASTMPTERAAVGSGVKHATVPQSVRLSTAPSRTRIYGQRFERERKKRRNDDD